MNSLKPVQGIPGAWGSRTGPETRLLKAHKKFKADMLPAGLNLRDFDWSGFHPLGTSIDCMAFTQQTSFACKSTIPALKIWTFRESFKKSSFGGFPALSHSQSYEQLPVLQARYVLFRDAVLCAAG